MSKRLLLLCVVLAAASQAASDSAFGGAEIFQGIVRTFEYLTTPHFSEYKRSSKSRDDELAETRQKVEQLKEDFIRQRSKGLRYDPDQNSFFKIFPKFVGNLVLGSPLQVQGSCFQDVVALANQNEDGSVTVTISLENADSLLCRAAFVISVDADTRVVEYFFSGQKEVQLKAPEGDADKWDLYERGARLFLYPIPFETVLGNLASSLALFEPCLTEGVMGTFAKLNLEFLENYAGIVMPERENAPEVMPIDQSLVRNGDMFHIMRLDGLDPMIAWAMGSATGHVAIAVWKDEELFLCESNAKSPYWPVNGIQCNPFDDWMEYGRRNDYNVVWAPLSRQLSDSFNETSAWEFIEEHLGVDYGWEVVLMGFLDSHDGNKICADTSATMCTEKEHFEMLFSVAEKVAYAAARVFKPAIMQRAGVDFDLPIVEAYYKAQTDDGIDPGDVHLIPEEDNWLYPTTKYGEPYDSDVSICNVFTCKVLRAAGIFGDIGDEIECGEISVNDQYRLKIYEDNFERPPQCVEADPENPLCQVLGKYSLRLDSQPGVPPRYNYVEPHPNFGQNCPSLAPDYLAPQDC